MPGWTWPTLRVVRDDVALEAAIRNPEGRRWAARAPLPFAGRWVVVAAEARTSSGLVAAFCARRDRMAIVGDSPDLDDLRHRLTQPETGIAPGTWHEIPARTSGDHWARPTRSADAAARMRRATRSIASVLRS